MGHSSKGGFSYSNLFNLDSLMSFRLPRQGDGFDSNANSSQDESRGNPDHGITSRECGTMKRKRPQIKAEAGSNSSARDDPDSNDEDDGDYSSYISEEHYRSMLGEHLQKYRQGRLKDSSSLDPVASRVGKSFSRRNGGHRSKSRKYNYEGRRLPFTESKSDYFTDMPIKQNNYYESDFTTDYNGVDRFSSPVLDSSYLDIGEGIHYTIPPTYDRLVSAFNLPSFSDVKVEEYFLKGTLDLGSLATMIASERRFSSAVRLGMGDPQPQYDSLQARLRALSASNSVQKFSLQICDIDLDSSCIPEGAAGSIQRSIMSEGGTLQIYFVKVLEKGDTYEIIERRLPKKQIVKKDPSVIEREEMEKMGKMWASIVRKDIPKYQKLFLNMHKKQAFDAKRFAEVCQREVKTKISRSLKWMRGAPARTRKLARDMLVFWKRVDKEQAELRKKEEKEAAEALKREEELREAKRQQQRLNFLLSQTELYSHFMQNKSESQTQDSLSLAEKTVGEEASQDIREEDPDEIELKKEAMKAAQNAVSQQKKITSAFDSECLKLRQASESGVEGSSDSIPGSSNIDLVHPSTMPVTSSVRTPVMFQGTLKEYQLKGLQWLVNCYEQGLNGILADEMGLGKTVQAITFLAHLAEEKNIWGPFLVVAPSSVLNNWADEISRFCPDLKTLPYWGVLNDRQVLRKNINPKRLYRRESPFHILITSYQLLVADEKYFRRVKWQYLVLDEAQAIKSSQSLRWRTMLTFNCRNRLLLTGTPIQNSMGELWALLHFIMPTLFDSHEQFTEWFSKGIENHAEHGGTLNEHQLSRLHAILKPFMLRRVKKDVMSELTGKTEIIVQCELSSRQQEFYQAIKNKISLVELLDGRRGNLSEKKLLNLMNIVVQLRKVCNHPELFERNEGSTYFYFGEIPNSLLPPAGAEGIHYTGAQNPIVYKIPKIVYQRMVRCSEIPILAYGNSLCRETFQRLFSIFSPDYIYRRARTFGFTCLMDLSPGEVSMLARSSVLERLLFSVLRWERQYLEEVLDTFMETEGNDLASNGLDREKVKAVSRMLLLPSRSSRNAFRTQVATGPESAPYEALVVSHQERLISCARLLKSTYAFIPPVRAPPIDAYCSDRSFAYKWMEDLHHPWVKRLFVGFARTSEFNGPVKPSAPPNHYIQEIDSEFPVKQPLLQLTYKIFGSSPPVRNFDPAKMLTDSGKLKTLDGLLKRLRAENHRVLLFAQMTKMLNILEDYMNFRKYRYLRLDGSSTIADRRDMVRDFQHRNDIFVFLLSTRAGGLGINLTAADTVIFYESDWNPTLDTQAMDRAHRLGQKKEVTVYRLICKETIEEKILQRASQKNTVQQLVMTGRHVQADLLASEDVVSLLIDDAQLEQKLRDAPLHLIKDRQKKKRGTKCILVDSEGVASLEDLSARGPGNEEILEEDKEPSSKKKKLLSEKRKLPKLHPSKTMNGADSYFEIEGSTLVDQENGNLQRPKRPKRSKKSRNECDESTPEDTIPVPPDFLFLSDHNNIASMDMIGVAEEENADGFMPSS